MKKFMIIAALVFCSSAFAGADPTPTPTQKIQIHQMRPDYDVSGLKSPDVEIHPYKKNHGASVNREEREDALTESGLEPAVKSWDELDRDVLYLKAQNLPFEKLTSQYPKIDKKALKKFYDLARGNE